MSDAGPVLRDIHVPAAAWWPLAPGWWFMALALLLLLAGAAWWWRRRASGQTLEVALREIDAMASAYAADRDAKRLVEDASRLLRRVALRVQPVVASEAGEAWRAFVHGHARDAGTRRALEQMLDARFRARPEVDVPALLSALRAWCGDTLRAGVSPRASKQVRTEMAP